MSYAEEPLQAHQQPEENSGTVADRTPVPAGGARRTETGLRSVDGPGGELLALHYVPDP